jgi:TRAP-type C4-dicarboxylate transport system permease small subunit
MFNLQESFELNKPHLVQKDSGLKLILCFFGIQIFLDSSRNQIPEIQLVQLIPGISLLFFFLAFFFLILNSYWISNYNQSLDCRQTGGTKTKKKLTLKNLQKSTFFFF